MLKTLLSDRLKKLEKYKASADPYPARVKRDLLIGNAILKFAELKQSRRRLNLAGRITGLRKMGRMLFADIEDASGRIQTVLKKDALENFELLSGALDLGDFLSVSGTLFQTDAGEKSLLAEKAAIAAKSLRPLPSQFYGLKDTEVRLRERYLELLLNPSLKAIFVKKALFWEEIRSFLKKEKFLEVETPALEHIPGGADAEPFVTHHNALDENFYLRISLELPLKKTIVAGFERVFEIGRIFRNEGIDQEHLQDYTQLEMYAAYEDYENMMQRVQKMYQLVIEKTSGSLLTPSGDEKIDWRGEWPKVRYAEIMKKEAGFDPREKNEKELTAFVRKEIGGETPKGKGRLIDAVFKKIVRPKMQKPSFLVDPPVEIEPLAKRCEKDHTLVERFQVMAVGTELGKGFSELNDPLDQKRRFEEQMALREAGDKEAQRLDQDFLTALEYGMPPTAGFGVSERLFSVIMDKPIRETVIFPLLKRKE